MASAQVVSNSGTSSRKQGHLEAGKRRLEEFRKKKAEGRVRKPAVTGQQQSTDVSHNETETLDNGPRTPIDFDTAATSGRDEPLGADTSTDNKTTDSFNTAEIVSINGEDASSRQSESSYNASYSDSGQKSVKEVASKHYQGSELHHNYGHQDEYNNLYPSAYNGVEGIQTNTTEKNIPHSLFHGTRYNDGNLYQSGHYPRSEPQLKEVESHAFAKAISPEKHSVAAHDTAGHSSTSVSGQASNVLNEDPVPYTISLTESFSRAKQSNGSMDFDSRRKLSSSANQEISADSAQWKSSDSLSSGFSFAFRNSSNPVPLNSISPETSTRPRRSSFLDSINVPRTSSQSHLSFTQSGNSEPFTSRTSDIPYSSDSSQPDVNNLTIGSSDKLGSPNVPDMYDYRNNSHSVSYEDGMYSHGIKDNGIKWNQDVPTAKKDENFAALEQYIEDLTQEKFSLKRDLDASRALAESLAAENSSLTESYNQQRASVNQLKSEMENLREEIKSQLLELDSIKMEYSEARLECNAADERAKILASEVIGLEEKALKLRSRELKLERELEKSNTEINSYKKKVSSLQKERQDLQFTIDALQEEKKLLQSKLRKASGNVKSSEAIKAPSVMKDISTSTEDLGFEVSNLERDMNSDVDTNTIQSTSNHELPNDTFSSGTSSSFQFLPENRELDFTAASAVIPPDQVRMIGNINSLISELALEKEELVRALNSESSQSSKLKELNKDLSRKLEVQTQRLELLTAQSMANENIVERPTDLSPADDIIAYTDEGDEVVERVLGWIMKLFPGGPSKRRPRKSL